MRSSGLLLFVCSGLLLSGGAILGGSTAWSLLRMSYYFWTTDLGVELGSSMFFIAGAILCLPTCWLASIVPYQRKSTSILGTLMVLVTASMLMLTLGVSSMSGLSRTVREPAALNASMLNSMTHVGFDLAVRNSFSAMQKELKCCGVHSYLDWYKHRRSLPLSCCGRIWNGKRCDQCTVPLYTNGCLRPALLELHNYCNSLSFLASAIIPILALTLFAGAYTLVVGTLERAVPRFKPHPMRIACLHAPAFQQYMPAAQPPPAPAALPPFFALTNTAPPTQV